MWSGVWWPTARAPTAPLVSYQINRQLSGWYLPPLVFRAIGADCLLLAEAVEKQFGALKLRRFGNERKFDFNKINSLGIQQFGNARRFRLKTGFSGVLQQPRLQAEVPKCADLRPVLALKPTFESALRFQRIKFQTETLLER